MLTPKESITIELTAKQTEAHLYLTDAYNRAILYGGGKGGGKSFLLCLWAYQWVEYLISFFEIKNIRHPVPLGFIGRKRSVDFNETTLETFKKVIPYGNYQIKSHDKEIIIRGLAKIDYGGLDDQESINKFNSAEYAFIAIDQAEETQRSDVSVLQASLRLRYNFKTPPYKELYTANPAECWLKEDFILGSRPKSIFIPALPDDNPYLPDDYKQRLRDSFSHDEATLKAYLEGDWDSFSAVEDSVFKPIWFQQCRTLKPDYDTDLDVKIIAVDVATKRGDNETVILRRIGNVILDIETYKNIPTTKTAQLIKLMQEKYQADTIVIDSDGFGEGVSDVLESQRIGVIEFHGGYGAQAMDTKRYRNLRTQFYVMTAKKIEAGLICLSQIAQEKYEKLKSQACQIKYRKPDPLCRYQIETKEDMRARGVMSPDLIDALVYSEYGLWLGKMGDIKAFAYR